MLFDTLHNISRQTNRLLALSIFIFIVGFIENAYAPDVQKFKIFIATTCKDVNTKSLVESYVKRELRSLQDVEILPGEVMRYDSDYAISLVVVEPTSETTGQKTGDIAIGYTFEAPFDPYKNLIPSLRKKFPKIDPIEIASLTGSLTGRIYLGVIADDTEDVKTICERVVAQFDTMILEVRRQINETR